MNLGRWQLIWWGRWPTWRRYQYPFEGPSQGGIYDLCLYMGLIELRRFAPTTPEETP